MDIILIILIIRIIENEEYKGNISKLGQTGEENLKSS